MIIVIILNSNNVGKTITNNPFGMVYCCFNHITSDDDDDDNDDDDALLSG